MQEPYKKPDYSTAVVQPLFRTYAGVVSLTNTAFVFGVLTRAIRKRTNKMFQDIDVRRDRQDRRRRRLPMDKALLGVRREASEKLKKLLKDISILHNTRPTVT